MMAAGEIQAGFVANAGIGREGPPQAGWKAKEREETASYRELFANADELGAELFRRSGIYPMHSTLVVKDEILEANPWLAKALLEAFEESKRRYVDRLRAGQADSNTDRRYLKQMKVVGDDPLPYGLDVNRRSIEALVLYAFEQRLIPKKLGLDELFVDT
jgi:4,5-dihydroxyphthalate decarboxylase